MLRELYTAALGMMPQQTRLETVANNIANSSTTGYKRTDVFERQVIDSVEHFANTPTGVEQDDPPVGEYTDYSKGSFVMTGNKLDLAIENDNAFFVLEDEDGNQYLTRAGNFTLSEDGFLETTDGKKLVGESGTVNIATDEFFKSFTAGDNKNLDIRITEQGDVFINDTRIDGIDIVRVENPQSLMHTNGSAFIAQEDTIAEIADPAEVNIRQGWLENSNVDIIKEMVKMIELQRMFELGSKVISTNDSTLDDSFRVGRVL